MHALLEELIESGPVLLDGATGTQLQARGLSVGACPELWNAQQPGKVEEVVRAYVAAGSRIVLTNTFGCNRFVLGRAGAAERVVELNRAGAEIALRGAEGRAKVFGSIGPSGVMLVMGEVSDADLLGAFSVQAQALADAGVDGLVIETMSDVHEATLAATAARATGLPVVACMTFGSGKARDRTLMGTTVEQAAGELTAAGVDLVGSNCGQGIDGFVPICRRLAAATGRPVWIKANAGLPEMVDGQTVYRETPQQFAAKAKELVDAGAGFLGGCCGTSPEFLRALGEALG